MTESGHFDVRTLGLLAAVAPLLFALAAMYLYHLWPRERSLPYWGAAGFCLAAAFALNAGRGDETTALLPIVATTLGFTSLCLFVVAVRLLLGVSGSWWWLGVAIPIALLVQVYFTFVRPNLGLRVLASSVANLVIVAAIAVGLWRRSRDRLRIPGRAMAGVFGGIAVVYLLRIWALGNVPADARWEEVPTVVLLAPFVAGFVAAVGTTILLTLAVSYQIETELTAERQRTLAANLELQRLTETDDLTGLSNRGHAEAVLARTAAEAPPTAVIMVDVDKFKAVNDTFGHAMGDTVLKQVAGALTRTATDATVIGRWGGEEFLVVVPGADAAKVQALAELLRRAVATVVLPDARAVTASFGVAIHRPGETTSELVGRADNALYDAKRSGRNQVALA